MSLDERFSVTECERKIANIRRCSLKQSRRKTQHQSSSRRRYCLDRVFITREWWRWIFFYILLCREENRSRFKINFSLNLSIVISKKNLALKLARRRKSLRFLFHELAMNSWCDGWNVSDVSVGAGVKIVGFWLRLKIPSELVYFLNDSFLNKYKRKTNIFFENKKNSGNFMISKIPQVSKSLNAARSQNSL